MRKLNPSISPPRCAGILLFGRNPQRFVASAEIICVRYATPSMSDEFVRQDIKGTLAEQIHMAEAFLVSNMRETACASPAWPGRSRVSIPWRWCVKPSSMPVAHRDYSIRGEGIRLLMFSDRLELYSPGHLPGHVTLENLKDESATAATRPSSPCSAMWATSSGWATASTA
ncbi:MAG: ATP-binding protein [Caldilineaceae bacterium]